MDSGFDERYPAIFQPGGEGLPRAFAGPAESGPPDTGPAEFATAELPQPQQPSVDRPAGALPAGDQSVDPAVESGAGDEPQDAAGTGHAVPGPVPWTARTWVLGLGTGMATIVLGVLCLLPKKAPALDPATASYVLVTLFFPLTDKVVALGPVIIIAGMCLLVAMFLTGAPRHPRASPWLRGGAALVAAAAMAAAGLSLFAVTLRPDILLSMFGSPEGSSVSYPWFQLTTIATMPLALFGLFAGSAVAIVRPAVDGRNSLSTARAVATGAVLLAGAAVSFYAPQIFTGSMASGTFGSGEDGVPLTPWPVTLIQLGPYLLLVGLAALLLAIYLRLTTVPVETGAGPDEARGEGPVDVS
ncbi:hypothetical protein [Arthrobacter wenxiniae]|uniref:hypothetical protein n=1 Tax=Arthrobacter wenxiniae TaxID=2713570 RepID=UPI001FE77C37|nr:hypothetical protein [Arthrobacter wenxiniae]